MAQQSANFLFKEVKKAKQGKSRTKHDDVFEYLSQIDELKSATCTATTKEDFMSLELIEYALKVRVACQLDRIYTIMRSSTKVSKKDFTNLKYGVDIVKMSNAHIRYVTFWNFKQRLNQGDLKCQNNLQNLTNFCRLYGLNQLREDSEPCFECGYFKAG